MYQYKIVKFSVKDNEEEISERLDELGKEGWELVNFQPSSELHGIMGRTNAYTQQYILIFKKQIKSD